MLDIRWNKQRYLIWRISYPQILVAFFVCDIFEDIYFDWSNHEKDHHVISLKSFQASWLIIWYSPRIEPRLTKLTFFIFLDSMFVFSRLPDHPYKLLKVRNIHKKFFNWSPGFIYFEGQCPLFDLIMTHPTTSGLTFFFFCFKVNRKRGFHLPFS